MYDAHAVTDMSVNYSTVVARVQVNVLPVEEFMNLWSCCTSSGVVYSMHAACACHLRHSRVSAFVQETQSITDFLCKRKSLGTSTCTFEKQICNCLCKATFVLATMHGGVLSPQLFSALLLAPRFLALLPLQQGLRSSLGSGYRFASFSRFGRCGL